jgi:hypothetical protein
VPGAREADLMAAMTLVGLEPVPGSDWRELLPQALELDGTRWTVDELLDAVAGCDAGLVEVVGWLCDELGMGRVRCSGAPDGSIALPRRYELAPGVPSYRRRLRR